MDMHCIVEKETVESLSKKTSGFQSNIPKTSDVNSFIDSFTNLRDELNLNSLNIKSIIDQFRKFTWSTAEDDETLKMLKALIDDSYNSIKKMREASKTLNRIKGKGILQKEITQVINLIDDWEEATNDLNFTFFVAPHDKEFQMLNDRLNSL